MPVVDRATNEDLVAILAWLKAEYDEDDGSGFWCNRRIIERSHNEGDDLWVIRHDGSAVSFQVGDYEPVITSTKKTFRGCGYASALLNASVERAHRDNVNVLDIECAPRESWAFWQKRGFERYGDMSDWGKITARMVLKKNFDLPIGQPSVPVVIGYYPEEAKYERGVRPICESEFESAKLVDGSYQLRTRALGLKDDEAQGDLVIRIEVDGTEIYFDKAKYEGAKAVGVINDWKGNCFYVDRVTPNAV